MNLRSDWTPDLIRALMAVTKGETSFTTVTGRTFTRRQTVIPVAVYLLRIDAPPLPVRGDVVPIMGLWSLVAYTERAGDNFIIHAWTEDAGRSSSRYVG